MVPRQQGYHPPGQEQGPWGEPADDVTALAINYIFFSVKNHGDVRGAYLEGLKRFFKDYIIAADDSEITSVVAHSLPSGRLLLQTLSSILNWVLMRAKGYSGLQRMFCPQTGSRLPVSMHTFHSIADGGGIGRCKGMHLHRSFFVCCRSGVLYL